MKNSKERRNARRKEGHGQKLFKWYTGFKVANVLKTSFSCCKYEWYKADINI